MRKLLWFIAGILLICGCGDEGLRPLQPTTSEITSEQEASTAISHIVVHSDGVQFNRIAEIGIKSTIVIWKLKNNAISQFAGTGFVVDDQRIATAYHVVEDFTTQDSILVHSVLNTTGTFQVAAISKTNIPQDIAILSVSTDLNLPSLKLGDIQDVFIGQKCYVISNPRGIVGTFSNGVVSGIRDDWSRIQFTAPVSLGSSGAALLDEYGHVIGIVKNIIMDTNDVNIAVSVDYLQELMQ